MSRVIDMSGFQPEEINSFPERHSIVNEGFLPEEIKFYEVIKSFPERHSMVNKGFA
ncbi:MAG: hypothetical protein KAS71_13575 [Bacteroidales bacterium]|nr:hypothetical protein [Bacteroidales bacterium]